MLKYAGEYCEYCEYGEAYDALYGGDPSVR